MDSFTLSLIVIVVSIYGIICLILLLFTFCLGFYQKIETALNSVVYSYDIGNPLGISVNSMDKWLVENNTTVGPILITLSLLDIKLWIDVILNLKFYLAQ